MKRPDHFLSYGKQYIDKEDENELLKVLRSDFLTQGPTIKSFEDAICDYTGAKYCVAVSSATAALHIAVAVLDLPDEAEGITSPISFVASSNAMLYNQVKPRFSDINEKTYNMDVTELKKEICKETKLIIPVHFAGQPCEMAEIYDLAQSNGIFLIEDAAHAIGSSYADGDKVGSCKYSDMTIFSFHPVKTITTGEGGAITTNSKEYYEKLLHLRSHGITKNPQQLSMNPGPWYYEMQSLGFNYRLTDLQASLGVTQLKKLDRFKARRRKIIKMYNEAFKGISWLITPYEREGVESCFHLYVVLIDFDQIKQSRKDVMEKLKDLGIGTQVHYIPITHQPYYQKLLGNRYNALTNVEVYYRKALSLPLYPMLSDDEVNYISNEVKNLCK